MIGRGHLGERGDSMAQTDGARDFLGDARKLSEKNPAALPGGARDSRAVCGDSPQTPDAHMFLRSVQILEAHKFGSPV